MREHLQRLDTKYQVMDPYNSVLNLDLDMVYHKFKNRDKDTIKTK